MNCPLQKEETSYLLLDYSAGRSAASSIAGLKSHVEKCPECASFLIQQTAVWDALDVWEAAPVSLGFNRSLWQRIEAAEAAPWYERLIESTALCPVEVSSAPADGRDSPHRRGIPVRPSRRQGNRPASNAAASADSVSVTGSRPGRADAGRHSAPRASSIWCRPAHPAAQRRCSVSE